MFHLRRLPAFVGVLALLVIGLFAGASGAQAAPALDFSCDQSTSSSTPVICLPAGSGEDRPAPLGAGQSIEFGGLVDARESDIADASIVITLPAALQVKGADAVRRLDLPIDLTDENDADVEGTPLPCDKAADGSSLTCKFGSLARRQHAVVLVNLTVKPTATIGASATFGVSLQPVAPDTYPATSVHATIDVVGLPHLQAEITPGDVSAVVGHKVTLRATVRNIGDYPAADTVGIGFLFPRGRSDGFRPHFRITNAPGGGLSHDSTLVVTTLDAAATPADTSSSAGQLRAAQLAIAADRVAATIDTSPRASPGPRAAGTGTVSPAPPGASAPAESGGGAIGIGVGGLDGTVGLWPLGTIAPGHGKSISIELTAVSPGRDDLDFTAFSLSDEQGCDGVDSSCEADATATLRAVAAPAAQPLSGSRPAGSGRLADTGAGPTVPTAYLGLLSLAAGIVLTAAARPRRPLARHRR